MTDSHSSFFTSSQLSTNFDLSFDDRNSLKRRRESLESQCTSSKRSNNDTMGWELSTIKSELVEAKSRITLLENQIQQLNNVRRELETIFENERRSLKSQQTRDATTIERCETRISQLKKREVDLREEVASISRRYETYKVATERKINEMQTEIYEMEAHATNDRRTEHNSSLTMHNELMQLQSKLKLVVEECAAQKKAVASLNEKIVTKNQEQMDYESLQLQNEALQRRVNELQYAQATYDVQRKHAEQNEANYSTIVTLQRELERVNGENAHLRENVRNKLILEEQVADLQMRVDVLKTVREEKNEWQAKCQKIEAQMDAWRVKLGALCDTGDDELAHICAEIERLQSRELQLVEENAKLEASVRALRKDLGSAKSELETLRKQVADFEATKKHNQTMMHRAQKKILLVSRERDCYKSQLDAYENDLTMSETNTTHTNVIREREKFESIVVGYKEYIARLETDLGMMNAAGQTQMAPVRADQLKRLQSELERLKADKEDLIKQRNQAQEQFERAIAPKSKIMHFVDNPFSEAVKARENEVTQLKTKIMLLKRRIQQLEENGAANATAMGENQLNESSFIGTAREVQELREKLNAFEIKHTRLKEVFRATSQEFRDTCHMLFGYRIDRTTRENYKLINMYSENADEVLVFQVAAEENGLKLLETPFTAQLEPLMQEHLVKNDSIPAFLSALTLELFRKSLTTIH